MQPSLTIVYSRHHSCIETWDRCRFGWWRSHTFWPLWTSHPSNSDSDCHGQSSSQKVFHLCWKRNGVLVCPVFLVFYEHATKWINWLNPTHWGCWGDGTCSRSSRSTAHSIWMCWLERWLHPTRRSSSWRLLCTAGLLNSRSPWCHPRGHAKSLSTLYMLWQM